MSALAVILASAIPAYLPAAPPGSPATGLLAVSSAGATEPPKRFGFVTAGELADHCEGTSAYATSFCYAYLAGIHDTMRAYGVWLTQNEFCAPAKLTQQDLRNVFVGFVQKNASFRTAHAASVAVSAVKGAYPCNAPNS